jgi:hypothetical protein
MLGLLGFGGFTLEYLKRKQDFEKLEEKVD